MDQIIYHLRNINKITGDIYQLLRNIRMALKYLNEEMIKKLITSSQKERGDFIAAYRALNGLENIDREDLFVWDDRTTRGHKKKLKRTTCKRDIKECSRETLNKLDAEVINVRNIHDFKSKLDNNRFGDGTS